MVVVLGGVAFGLVLATSSPGSPQLASSKGASGAPPAGGPVLDNLAVSTAKYTFDDKAQPLDDDGQQVAATTVLPTYVWRPKAQGRYPLVVFAHGFNTSPTSYRLFLSGLASDGYIVAAPAFPFEDPARGYALTQDDVAAEAPDVSFVITSMLHSRQASSIAPGEIAVVGHSDGADVALMVAYESGTLDHRVRAVVADAPDPITDPVVPSNVPLLLMQGDADTVVPYSSSQTVFTQVSAPRYYLTLLGADHYPPIEGDSEWSPTVDQSVADFLDATVAGRGPGTAALDSELGKLAHSTLKVAR